MKERLLTNAERDKLYVIIKWLHSCKTAAQIQNVNKYYVNYFMAGLRARHGPLYQQCSYLDGIITGLSVGKQLGMGGGKDEFNKLLSQFKAA